LLESGILLTALVSVLLNAFFNSIGSNESAPRHCDCHSRAAEHV
jgi:xanthine/uracil permease